MSKCPRCRTEQTAFNLCDGVWVCEGCTRELVKEEWDKERTVLSVLSYLPVRGKETTDV